MNIRSLNNATTFIKVGDVKLLVDPWMLGDIYHGAWSPAFYTDDLSFLSEVTHVFISHIHEDHWDLKTIQRINKNVKIFIPDMTINKVISRSLFDFGYKNITFLPLNAWHHLPNKVSMKIISPLNAFGQDSSRYIKGYELDATNIDTSLLVSAEGTNHLFLCDNTPYDLDKIVEQVDCSLTTLWYPFNSYAQDFPICYEIEDKKKINIRDEMHRARRKVIQRCVEVLQPQIYFPHSADFILNGPIADQFESFISKYYVERREVAKTYQLAEGCNVRSESNYLNCSDELVVLGPESIAIERDVHPAIRNTPKVSTLSLPKAPQIDTKIALERAFTAMEERIDRFGLNIGEARDWFLNLRFDHEGYMYDFSTKNVVKLSEPMREPAKVLQISLSSDLLHALLQRKIHWNNAMIGCLLRVKRSPEIYCQPLYKALNFLHL